MERWKGKKVEGWKVKWQKGEKLERWKGRRWKGGKVYHTILCSTRQQDPVSSTWQQGQFSKCLVARTWYHFSSTWQQVSRYGPMYTPVIDFEHFCCLASDIVKSGLRQLILSIFAAWHQIWSKVPSGSRFLSIFHDWPQKWSKVTSGSRFSAFSLLGPRNGEKYFLGNDSDNFCCCLARTTWRMKRQDILTRFKHLLNMFQKEFKVTLRMIALFECSSQ